MTEKEYWFKIEGRIYAENRDEANEQIHNMAVVGKNCERAFYKVDEVR